jgi:hypothetical protein
LEPNDKPISARDLEGGSEASSSGDIAQSAAPVSPLKVEDVVERLGPLSNGTPSVISIPVWGWTGDGKTCALLAATQGARVENNGISFGLVKNTRELAELEKSVDGYVGLGLATTAIATAEKMRELYETFFTELSWPHGTETATPYLFEVISAKGTVGYAMFPDLRGGSYQDFDGTAIVAMESAHACILVVNASLYVDESPRANEYRNDVLRLLQASSRALVPVLVLLAKSDEYSNDSRALDDSRKKLHQLSLGLGSNTQIAQVSVLGEKGLAESAEGLPPVAERDIDSLVGAWVSITVDALTRNRDELLKTIPRTNLQGAIRHKRVGGTKVRELRPGRELSDSPGRICWGMSHETDHRFLFINEADGQLHEVSIDATFTNYKFEGVVSLNDWVDPASEVAVVVHSESVFVGPKEGATSIWKGTRGQGLARAPLPYPMASWWPVSGEVLVALDEHGKLHSLRFTNDKWQAIDFVEGFVTPSEVMIVRCLEGGKHIVALNGTSVESVRVSGSGQFEDRVKFRISIVFDTNRVDLNAKGTAVAVNSAHELCVGQEKQAEPIPGVTESGIGFSIARSAPVLSWLGADDRLYAGLHKGEKVVSTPTHLSPVIEGTLTGMAWNPSGSLLVASYEGSRWGWLRTFGLGQ